MGADYESYVKTIETHVLEFLALNILAIGRVLAEYWSCWKILSLFLNIGWIDFGMAVQGLSEVCQKVVWRLSEDSLRAVWGLSESWLMTAWCLLNNSCRFFVPQTNKIYLYSSWWYDANGQTRISILWWCKIWKAKWVFQFLLLLEFTFGVIWLTHNGWIRILCPKSMGDKSHF